MQAAARAQCVAHLGIVHIVESGAAEPEYDAYRGPARWNRYGYDDDDELEDEAADEDFSAVTVDDTWRYIDEWRLHWN